MSLTTYQLGTGQLGTSRLCTGAAPKQWGCQQPGWKSKSQLGLRFAPQDVHDALRKSCCNVEPFLVIKHCSSSAHADPGMATDQPSPSDPTQRLRQACVQGQTEQIAALIREDADVTEQVLACSSTCVQRSALIGKALLSDLEQHKGVYLLHAACHAMTCLTFRTRRGRAS